MSNSEKFDIETFNQKKDANNMYQYELDNGSIVIEEGPYKDGNYTRTISTKNTSFIKSYRYYPNGITKFKGWLYPQNFFCGIWYFYNEKGELEREMNFDKPFLFTWDDLLLFCDQKGIDISKTISIKRNTDSLTPFWELLWRNKKDQILYLKLNGKTGKIIEEKELKPIMN